MAMKPGLRVSQTQRLALTPALRQSIGILGLSANELSELVAVELEQNPLLLLETDHRAPMRADYRHALENVAQERTLAEKLKQQISVMAAPKNVSLVANFLAGDLTDQGFLPDSDAAIAKTLSLDLELVQQAISLLQACEPTGVGARDLSECLGLQLVAKGESDLAQKVIVENLSDFARNDWTSLKRKSGLKKVELQRLAEILQSLNPFPVSALAPNTNPGLFPDVSVAPLTEGGYAVELIGSVAPSLRVDQNLLDSTQSSDPASTGYLRDQTVRANSLIRAIEARSKTILRISQEIVVKQHAFFALGHSHLLPQTQAEIASALDLHPSTVTRAVANKALVCPLGVFELKFFFTSSLNSLTSDAARSAYVVQQEIRKMITTESATEILSDDQIATSLRQSGVDIARRTVAKYRQCLNIPSSVQRRRSKRVL